MLDSNILISALAYKSEQSVKAVEKAETDDHLILPSVVEQECIEYTRKRKKAVISERTMHNRLSKLDAERVTVVTPKVSELKKRYYIRDENDYKILNAADKTNTDIFVTGDKDYFDNVKGLDKTDILHPTTYNKEIRPVYRIKKLFGRRVR